MFYGQSYRPYYPDEELLLRPRVKFAGDYEALRLRRCMRKNTRTPAAIINSAVSRIWVIAFSFLMSNTPRSGGFASVFRRQVPHLP
jgi:hypothetical protein